jgi:two-component system sensor histidine kinase YesM
MTGLSVFALKFSFDSYDSLVYNQSAEVLNLYSDSIENELHKVEELSYSIVTDNKLQEYVTSINTEEFIDFKLRELLVYYSLTKSYIASVNFITPQGKEYIFGNNSSPLNRNNFEYFRNKVSLKKGGIVWFDPMEGNGFLMAAREIRDIANGSLKTMGTIVIRVKVNKLIEDAFPKSSKYKSEVTILSNNRLIYSNKDSIDLNNFVYQKNNSDSQYYTLDINNKNFFITHTKSQYSGWTYINMVPSREIFISILALRIFLIFIYGGITVLAIFASIMFSNGITRPIVTLKNRMKNVEKGDFSLVYLHKSDKAGDDEIEHLKYDFGVMMNKINTLIRENYVKQIMIQETELKALQAQMNPHFLYNTLDTIKWMGKSNRTHEIAVLIESLSNLLRSTMSKKEDITIQEEMDILGDYINIQKFRYEERLNVTINIHGELKKYRIPKLTLQPIVENSIKYAVENMLEPCYISITSIKNLNSYDIIIEDNGPGMDMDYKEKILTGQIEAQGNGIGLKNIDGRLKLYYGDEYGLTIESELKMGTKVIVCIPLS